MGTEVSHIVHSTNYLCIFFFSTMLVFIHGLWAHADVWTPFIHYFTKQNVPCTALNLRDGLDMRTTRVSDYVHQVKTVATEDDILIGHSMGGLLVQKVAEEMQIKGGVAICPSPPKGIHFGKKLLFSSLRYVPRIIMNTPFKPSFPFYKKIFVYPSEDKARSVYATLEPESARVTSAVTLSTVAVAEKKVTCPLLFIARSHDTLTTPALVRQIAQKYHAEYVVEEGYHWIFDTWEPLAERIRRFITDINTTVREQ